VNGEFTITCQNADELTVLINVNWQITFNVVVLAHQTNHINDW
jgi:hypothetical protein